MVWSDEPTYAQLQCIYRWMEWRLPVGLAREAVKWLEDNRTRKEVAGEVGRIKKLYDTHSLDENTYCDSEIWDGFPWKGKKYEAEDVE